MRTRLVSAAIVLLPLLSGCASSGGSEPASVEPEPPAAESEPPPPAAPEAAPLVAAEARTPEARREALLSLWSRCGLRPRGRQALVVLAAHALDTGAGGRDPDLAATAAATAVESEPARSWLRPVAAALYLSALDLGGEVVPRRLPAPAPGDSADAASCEAAGLPASAAEPPVALPSLRDTAMAVRVERLRKEVERLRRLLEVPEEP